MVYQTKQIPFSATERAFLFLRISVHKKLQYPQKKNMKEDDLNLIRLDAIADATALENCARPMSEACGSCLPELDDPDCSVGAFAAPFDFMPPTVTAGHSSDFGAIKDFDIDENPHIPHAETFRLKNDTAIFAAPLKPRTELSDLFYKLTADKSNKDDRSNR